MKLDRGAQAGVRGVEEEGGRKKDRIHVAGKLKERRQGLNTGREGHGGKEKGKEEKQQ